MAESTNESAAVLTNGDASVHISEPSAVQISNKVNRTTKINLIKPRKVVRKLLQKNDDEKATQKMNRKIVIQKKRFRLAYAPRNGVAMHPMEHALIMCKTPNRCQQKMRLLRKTLRRTAWNCVIAAGLECAACYNLQDLKNRSPRIRANSTGSACTRDPQTQSAPSETPKGAVTIDSPNLLNGTTQSPPAQKPLDWTSHFPCIFCEHAPSVSPPKPKQRPQTIAESPVLPRKEVVVPPPSDNLDWLRSLQLQLPSLNLGINMDGGSLSSALGNQFTPSPLQTSTLTASVWSKVNPFRFMPEEPTRPTRPDEEEEKVQTEARPSTSKPDTPSTPVSPAKPSRSRGQGRQRRYTPSELRAAIDEVERGNVGTRKAALLYGIPRSTLRNKVGKLLTIKKPEDMEPPTDGAVLNGSQFQGLPAKEEPVSPNKQDITFALKRIISRHLSDKYRAPATKVKAEGKQKRSRNIDPASRHKRGRYRKYKQGDLEEALRLVKQGEMTVHRAGHLFGIPHSTLEYKIKERNGTLPHNPSVSSELEKTAKTGKGKKTAVTETAKTEINSVPATPTTPFLPDFSSIPADLNGTLLGLPPTPGFLFSNNPFQFGTGGEGNIFNQLLALQLLQNSMMGLNALPPPTFPLFEGNPAPAGAAPFRPWAEGQEAGTEVIKPKKTRKRKMEDAPLNLTVSKDKAAKLVE